MHLLVQSQHYTVMSDPCPDIILLFWTKNVFFNVSKNEVMENISLQRVSQKFQTLTVWSKLGKPGNSSRNVSRTPLKDQNPFLKVNPRKNVNYLTYLRIRKLLKKNAQRSVISYLTFQQKYIYNLLNLSFP